ncbi:MAG: rhodanese-like domain-containing protein [Pseudomonadales bacterium]|nr:rhodanese-like domain-containing protein [Pseudomonadales bacterium]
MKITIVLLVIALVGGVAVFFMTSGTVTPQISQEEFQEWMASEDQPILLDVRTANEFAKGHVPGARNISHDLLAGKLVELGFDKAQPIVVYCRSGRRAGIAEDILRDAGFTNLKHLDGDMLGWQNSGLKVEQIVAPIPTSS